MDGPKQLIGHKTVRQPKALGAQLFESWDKLLALASALLVFYPMNPVYMQMPYRDSGVFLYFGWRILRGEIPYLDLWDHKPPVIYYINALGLAISGNSRWGVWGIEILSFFVATWLALRLLKQAFGTLPALIGITLFISGFIITIDGGNLTEEYAIPIQFACFLLACCAATERFDSLRGFAFGALIALAFFTKQTTIGVGLALATYLIAIRMFKRETAKLSRELAVMAGGGITVLAFVVCYFAYFGGLAEFIDAVFVYNFSYVAQNPGHIYLPRSFIQNGLLILAPIGSLLFVFVSFYYPEPAKKWSSLLTIATIDMIFDIMLVNFSGNLYRHYYLTLLPALTILTTFTVFCVYRFASLYLNIQVQALLAGIMIIFMIWYQSYPYRAWMKTYGSQKAPSGLYSISQIEQQQFLLVWGAESGVNFMLQKPSPSRFNYLYPLYQLGYTREDLIIEFLDEVMDHHPVILNTEKNEMKLFEFPIHTKEVNTRLDYLKAHYHRVGQEASMGWSIYEYAP